MPYLGSTPPAIPISGADIQAGTISTANIADDAVTLAKIADVNVTTAKIANDAITLAKLAAGTDGELITWDASGNPAAVPVGTATHVLTSNGTGAAPTFQEPAAGGAWTLIASTEASGSASITVTGLDTTYSSYAVTIANVLPATDGEQFLARFGDSGGIDSGASDYTAKGVDLRSASPAYIDGTSESSIFLGASGCGSATGEGVGGTLFFETGAQRARLHGTLHYHRTGDSVYSTSVVGGSRNAVITVDRIQFLFASGNIASGRISVYGISHT